VNPYNGFDGKQRLKALAWLKGEYRAGRRVPPTVCDACGQEDGIIEAHSEDYSDPFGPHTGKYGLCFRCHMMLHSRDRNPEAWLRYKQMVLSGWRFEPAYSRDYRKWIVPLLGGGISRLRGTQHDPLPHSCLLYIPDHSYNLAALRQLPEVQQRRLDM